MHYTGSVLSPHFNNIFFAESIPILLPMLRNIFTTSKLTNKQFSCKFPFLFSISISIQVSLTMFNICCMSYILVSFFKTFGKRHFSTKIDRFFTVVPLPLVIILAGLLSLWVFIIPYILPGFTYFGLVNLFQFSSMAFWLIHFSIHVLILSSNIFVGSLFKRVNELLFI